MNRVSVGMTKPEVIKALGQPNSVAGMAEQEDLVYNLVADSRGYREQHVITLINGRVYKFGRPGDYRLHRSTGPASVVNVQVNR